MAQELIVKCCGRGLIQAASLTSIPSTNFAPEITAWRRADPFNDRQLFDALSISLKTIVRHAVRLPLPFVFSVPQPHRRERRSRSGWSSGCAPSAPPGSRRTSATPLDPSPGTPSPSGTSPRTSSRTGRTPSRPSALRLGLVDLVQHPPWPSAATPLGSLSSTFAVLCTQHRCSFGRVPDLPHRLPEAQRPVADRQRRLDLQAAGLAVQEQLLPRLLALPVAVGDGDQLLLAVGGRPHQDQDALPALLQADVEVDAVGPDVDVVLARQRPLAPGLVLVLPDGLEPGDGRGRQPRGVGAAKSPVILSPRHAQPPNPPQTRVSAPPHPENSPSPRRAELGSFPLPPGPPQSVSYTGTSKSEKRRVPPEPT